MLSRIGETLHSLFSTRSSHAAETVDPTQMIPSHPIQPDVESTILIESSKDDVRHFIGAYFTDLLSSRPSVDALAQNPLLKGVKRKTLRRAVENSDRTPAQIAEALTQLAPPTPNRDGRRLLRQWSSRSTPPTAGADEETLDPVASRNNRQGRTNITPPRLIFVHPQQEYGRVQRSLMIEGLNKSTVITNDDELRRLLEKAKSELPPDVLLNIVEQLRTQNPRDLFERYKKRVKGGPFEGYHEVRRGKTGRVLFEIDKDGTLHVRVGTHDEIYGTGKYKKDAGRSL